MDLLNSVIQTAFENQPSNETDFIGENGLLHCGNCHTPKECPFPKGSPFWDNWAAKRRLAADLVKPLDGVALRGLPIVCACQAQATKKSDEEQKRKDFNMRIERLRRDGLSDNEYKNWTFANDDQRTPEISQACQSYVENWQQMRTDNIGLLFHGHVGTGKTFYACCIANALLDKCIPVLVTNFPRLIRALHSTTFDNNNMEALSRLQRYELLVIDDLGTERSTEYAQELVYSVIDTRYRSGKPLIITTNLSPDEFKAAKAADVAYNRIYDRISENSPINIKMVGESRRADKARGKSKKYKNLLGF